MRSSLFRRSLSIVFVALLFFAACFYSVPFASGLPPIWYDLYIYSDFGDVTVDPDGGSYIEGTVVTVTFTDLIFPEMAYTRFVYDGVVGYGDGSYTGSSTTFQVTMNSEISEEVIWQIQYQVDFETAGISGDTGSAVIVTIDGAPKTAAELPFIGWYDSGAIVSFTYNSPVSEIYVLTGMTVSRTDASGHLFMDSISGTYTVSTFATISGLYTTVTTTTSSTTSTSTATTTATTTPTGPAYYGATTTATSTHTTGTGGLDLGWTPGGIPEIPDIFGGLRDWWETMTSGGLGAGGFGGFASTGFGAWLNGCTYEIPNYIILLFVSLFFFSLILFARRRKKKKKRHRRM